MVKNIFFCLGVTPNRWLTPKSWLLLRNFKYCFDNFSVFSLFSTMWTNAQACICWSKYTTIHNCIHYFSKHLVLYFWQTFLRTAFLWYIYIFNTDESLKLLQTQLFDQKTKNYVLSGFQRLLFIKLFKLNIKKNKNCGKWS